MPAKSRNSAPNAFVVRRRGVKGTHLVLRNEQLSARMAGRAFYFHDGTNRMVISLPVGETVLVGTTAGIWTTHSQCGKTVLAPPASQLQVAACVACGPHGARMTRSNHPSNRNVAEVAWLYYVKNLTQGEIANTLGLSRPTIISYLKLAKERQIVCVKIAGEHFRINALADSLKSRFALEQVQVIPDEGLTGEALARHVCEAAAHYLPDFVAPGDELGVSWGQTVWFVSESLPYWPVADLTVRQLIGSMANPLLPTSESCSTEIARRLSAACINLNAPAVCTTADLAARLKAEPIIAEQLSNLRRCNKALYSLSPCIPDTHVVQFKIATEKDIADYVRRGAVGIIAGRFVDADGRPVLGELDDRLISADHETLRAMTGLLVVSGLHKLEPTRAALKGGYVNEMVVDTVLAEALLAA